MKKGYMVLLCMVMAGMVLGGCAAGKISNVTATPSPTATNSPAPTMRVTQAPTTAPQMDTGMPADSSASATQDTAMTPAQAGKMADQIEEAVERLSEVDDAEVYISGTRALVAVEFDDQYSAGLDERMKKMITDAVKKEDNTLTEVEITDDSTLYGQIKGLGERLMKATGADELADDFTDLWERVTGM